MPDSWRVPSWYAALAAYAWRFLVIAAAVFALAYVVVLLRLVFIPVFVAILVASIMNPAVVRLRARGWRPLPATWAVLLSTLLALAGIIALIVPAFVRELDDLGRQLELGFDRVVRWLGEGPLNVTEQQVDAYIDRGIDQLQANAGIIGGGVFSGVVKTGEIVAGILLTFILLFFFLKDSATITSWIGRQLSEDRRVHADEMGRRAWATLSAYARGTAIIALVDAVLIGVALVIIGNPLALPLGVITFFASFFPIVGAVLAGIIAALVTLVTNGFTDALIVTAVIVAVQQIEGDVLQPMVMGRLVRLHPLVILLALTAGAILAGIAGAFVAVPLTAVGASVGSYLKTLDRPGEDQLDGSPPAGAVEARG